MHKYIIVGISLRDRDMKYAVSEILNHMILKSRTGLHVYIYSNTKCEIKHTYTHKQPYAYTCINMICTYIQDVHMHSHRSI